MYSCVFLSIYIYPVPLALGSFTIKDLTSALNHKDECYLIADIHVCLLRPIVSSLIAAEIADSNGEDRRKEEWRFDFFFATKQVTHLNWMEVLKLILSRYLHG